MIMSLLATYALSTILVNIAILIWGGGYSGLPGVLSGSVRLLGVNVSVSRLVSFACAIGVSLAVWWLLQFTRFGRAVRSASQAPELASISGIAIDQVRLATFALGSAHGGACRRAGCARLRHRSPTRFALHHQGVRRHHRWRHG